MRFLIFLPVIFGVFFSCPENAVAAKRKWRSQNALVRTDGASVYKFSNFDSPVVVQLPANKVVRISKKIYKGIGGFGTFYKVRIRPRKYGYIADIDVVPQYATKNKKTGFIKERKREKENPEFQQAKDDAEGIKDILYSKYMGFALGGIAYTEKIANSVEVSSINTFGLKMVGPGVLFEGPPVNFEIMGSASVPSFYEKYASGPVSGFMTIGHVAVPVFLPYNKRDTAVLVWLGAMGVYAKYSVPGQTSSPIDSQELRLGLAALVSVAHRLTKKYYLQADYKYYHELEGYSGYTISIGVEY